MLMEKKEHSTVVNLKKNIEPNQTFTGSYKKCEALGELQDTHNIKSKKANKFWWKLSDQDNVRFKDYVCLSKKEAYNNKWNVLEQGSLRNRLGFLCKW